MNSAQRQGGHTLIELMAALALGALVVGGALTLYLAQRTAYVRAVDAAVLEEGAEVALSVLGRQIQLAAYAPLGEPRPAGLFGCADGRPSGMPDAPSCVPSESGSDGVLVRYVGDTVSTWPSAHGQASDCLGQGLGAPEALVVNRFYARTSSTSGRPELYCEGNGRPGVGQPVVEGVERLGFRYWARGAWRDALSVEDWKQVAAVEICVQMLGAARAGAANRAAAAGLPGSTDCHGRPMAARAGGSGPTPVRRVFRRYVAIRNQQNEG